MDANALAPGNACALTPRARPGYSPRVALDLVVRGGTVITPEGVGAWDVGIQGERIAVLALPGTLPTDGAQILDASGRIVSPGGVEPPTHPGHGGRARAGARAASRHRTSTSPSSGREPASPRPSRSARSAGPGAPTSTTAFTSPSAGPCRSPSSPRCGRRSRPDSPASRSVRATSC